MSLERWAKLICRVQGDLSRTKYDDNMQSIFLIYYNVILIILALQFFWLLLNQRAKKAYFKELMRFQTPTSVLSRYYDWRISSVKNTAVESISFFVVLFAFIIYYLVALEWLVEVIVIVTFLVVLPVISAVIAIKRTSEYVRVENEIESRVESSDDKIAVARIIVDNLFHQGPNADGQAWLALFRIARKRSITGYSIRDVLLEKERELRQAVPDQSVSQSENKRGVSLQ